MTDQMQRPEVPGLANQPATGTGLPNLNQLGGAGGNRPDAGGGAVGWLYTIANRLTSGLQKAIVRGGAKGATAAADITGTAEGADHQALDVQMYHGGVAKDPTAIRALTSADVVALGAGTNRIGSVRPVDSADADLTAAKGTQTSRFVGTQDAKDSGRVTIAWTVNGTSATQTADALVTVTESRDGAPTTTFTSKVVTSGKRLRLQSWTASIERTTGTGVHRNRIRIRFNTSGAVTNASPIQWLIDMPNPAVAAVNNTAQMTGDFPDGVEYLGDGTKQIAVTWESPDWVAAAQIDALFLTIIGFEY